MIKEDILKLIRANQMIEWGELQGQLYGTSADSVRQIIRFEIGSQFHQNKLNFLITVKNSNIKNVKFLWIL